ncbi:MAG: acylneuraminate cytidylyltransferase [Planctomycetes bacterium]|nr:acylneuraminate cytidylyltransferase [Planctomycetota bacterium]
MSAKSAFALIPARGGSRGIPGKNIKRIAGRPLIHWTLRAALGCRHIQRVFVSTDDPAIAAVARLMPGVEVLPRDPATATDTASTEAVVFDALPRIGPCDDLVLIQATSPLLTSADLDRGFALRAAADATSCLSVVREKRFLWSSDAGGLGSPLNYRPTARPRRQDFAGHLVENGAFYLSTCAAIRASGCRISGPTSVCEMDADSAFEIDEPVDWVIVEGLLARRRMGRAAGIGLLICDVDGTLTDGSMYYGPEGEALKSFNTRDAHGMGRLREGFGIPTGVISREDSPAVRARCRKLGLELAAHGVQDKVAVARAWCAKLDIGLDQIAFIGDDTNDLPLLRMAGFSACPADGAQECRDAVDVVLSASGGKGCVREFCEFLIAARTASR